MRKICAFTIMIFVALAYATAGGNNALSKMSSFVRLAAQKAVARKDNGKLRAANSGRAPRLTAFVCIDNAANADSIFAANDCKIFSKRGDIYIATIPTDKITALAANSGVRRIEAQPLDTEIAQMDSSRGVINATDAHNGTSPLPQAYDGTGVVVGIQDIGFDLAHPTFLNSDNSESRIRVFWDMLASGDSNSDLPIGRDYTSPEGIAAVNATADVGISYHGTHCLGIAAGTGYDTPYRGIAYGSDLGVVATVVSDNESLVTDSVYDLVTDATHCMGFEYLFGYAESEGKPCVVSYSIGSNYYDTQEDSLYQVYVNALVGAGHILVSSAGNSGQELSCIKKPAGGKPTGAIFGKCSAASFTVKSAKPMSLCFTCIPQDDDEQPDTFRIYSDSCEIDSTTSYVFPSRRDGDTLTVEMTRFVSSINVSDTVCYVSIGGNMFSDEDCMVGVSIAESDADVLLRLASGAGFVNIDGNEMFSGATNDYSARMPAVIPNVIAVGNLTCKTGYKNIYGDWLDTQSFLGNSGSLEPHSGIGPSPFGCIKPEVVAPGVDIISACARGYIENNPDIKELVAKSTHNGESYPWTANSGTSMSTPMVAGVIALWLQANPQLTPTDVLDVLAHTSSHPDESLSYPNNLYGYGLINAYRGLLYILGFDGIDELDTKQLQNATVSVNADGDLSLAFANAPSLPFTVKLFSASGAVVSSHTIAATGQTTYVVGMPPLPTGVYAVQVSSTEKALNGSALIVKK